MDNIEEIFEKYWFLTNSKKNQSHCKNNTEVCCLIIEDTLHFLGIVATALYRESKIQTAEIDHTLFLSFERSFFGSWLYIIRKIGEVWHYQNYTSEFFPQWYKFFAQYAYNTKLISLSSDLLRFRNDSRHGGMEQNETSVQSAWQSIQLLLVHIDFINHFGIQVQMSEQNFFIGSITNSCNNNPGIFLIHDNDGTKINLHPFVIPSTTDQSIILQNVGKDKESFYQMFAIKNRYDLFLQQKEGKLLSYNSSSLAPENASSLAPKNSSLPLENSYNSSSLAPWNIHEETKEKLEQATKLFSKILLTSPPGGGKSVFLQNISFPEQITCPYLIEDSPLKIKPLTALKTILFYFSQKLQYEYVTCQSVPEGIKELQQLTQKFPEQKFTITIDGLFSTFCQHLFDNKWLDIINTTYHKNVVWIISATKNTMIPRFFDNQIDLPAITKEEIKVIAPNLDIERALLRSQGIPLFVNQYIAYGENNLYSDLHWEKYYQFFVKEPWQQKLLSHLANTTRYISVLDMATHLEVFTPKIEKFIHKIKILLKKNEHGYTIDHPLCGDYIRRQIL